MLISHHVTAQKTFYWVVHLHRRQKLGTFTVNQAIRYRSVGHYWETVANRLICIYRTLTQCTDVMIHTLKESIWGTTNKNENAHTLTFHAMSCSLIYKLHNSLLYCIYIATNIDQ